MTETELIRALIDETVKYSSLINSGRINSTEYRECKATLEAIQEELDSRHPHTDPHNVLH